MYAFQENKKQTEELNSSKIQETIVSYTKAMVQLKELYDDGLLSGFKYHVFCDQLHEATLALLANFSSFGDYMSSYSEFDDMNMSDFEVQSEITHESTISDTTAEQVNVGFTQNIEDTTLDASVPTDYVATGSLNSELSKYLSRPNLIISQTWNVGNSIDISFNPWHLFFARASIKRKVDNYAFVRCKLHLKFVINASPFYYSSLMASYNPLDNWYNSGLSNQGDELIAYSQRPNIRLYPQTNQGGEMVLPFIYPYDWLPLTSYDLGRMGTIKLDSFQVLRSANATVGTNINIQVYAWAEEVELSGLTVDLAVQSSEYSESKGPVSKPASAIARAAGQLSSLPVIGSYMTATSVAAGAVANIASLFGYSKVPVIENTKAFQNLPFHGLASTDISGPVERLGLDSKNELTIDNSPLGEPEMDPLMIATMVQRKSYLTQFEWTSSAGNDLLLWNAYVSPYYAAQTADVGQTILNPTPMWTVANLFDYWRGDIIYEFDILCSQYHRGRLRVSWDPVGGIGTDSDNQTEVYNQIIDIQENTNFTVRVPYTQKAAYFKVPSNPLSSLYGTVALAADNSDTINGILTVRVLNDQTSPTATADITVLVSVRGAENLEFAAPCAVNNDLKFFTVQCDTVIRPEGEEIVMGESSVVDKHLNLIYMGEHVVSLRTLLMRSNFALTCTATTELTTEMHTNVMARRPIYSGYDTSGIHTALDKDGILTVPYTFTANTPYHLLSPCFLGERGSFTWHLNLQGHSKLTSLILDRKRVPLNSSNYNFTSTSFAGVTDSKIANSFVGFRDTTPGAMMLNQNTNTGCSLNVPMYSRLSFLDTRPGYRTTGLSNVSGDDSMRTCFIQRENDGLEQEFAEYWFNVGPDYSPFFFLNVPVMFVYNHTPVPV